MPLADLSPLKHLPLSFPIREKLFLDGICHAAEVADFAYSRLKGSLKEVPDNNQLSEHATTSIYLDAWACVDAIDRLRSLVHQYPSNGVVPKGMGLQTFQDATLALRTLRNVADHVAKRIDHLISRKASAMGDIAWIEHRNTDGHPKLFTRYIRPGFLGAELQFNLLLPKDGDEVELPIGHVHLHAGGATANLSAAVAATRIAVSYIESVLGKHYAQMKSAYSPMPRLAIASAQLNMALAKSPGSGVDS